MAFQRRPKIGVMGSASDIESSSDAEKIMSLAGRLGRAIAERGCILITGATRGLPDRVSREVRSRGGLTMGISPAISDREHTTRYNLPLDGAEVIIYTGFGLKGRNLLNIRASDIVIIFGGSMGTLNEFTIAYDEGKIIGVLEGSGGVADHIREILNFSNTPITSRIIFDEEPEPLLDSCLNLLNLNSRVRD